jgi:hypothetical protein
LKKKRRPTIAYVTGDWSWGTEPLQPNGCAWYRCTLPMHELQKHGWITGIGFPGFGHEKGFGLILADGKIIHGWDIIVFKLLMQRTVLEAMDRAKELGQKIVVDVDDWFEGLEKSNRAYDVTSANNNPDNNREIYAQIIQKADAIITSTPFLFDYYSAKRSNVFLVRNGIDSDRWKRRRWGAQKQLRVGWVGATPWRSNDLEQLSPWFNEFIKKNNVLFHHSGHTSNAPLANELLGVPKTSTKILPLVPILQYPKLFEPIDVGIVPLNDVKFNHAKSFIKGLEYAAAGVPFVSSYSPEYEFLASSGVGRVAHNTDEWLEHMEELMFHKARVDEINKNYEGLQQFTMAQRGLDWDATYRFILENL